MGMIWKAALFESTKPRSENERLHLKGVGNPQSSPISLERYEKKVDPWAKVWGLIFAAPVAQLAERLFAEQKATGSKPVRCSTEDY